MVGGKSILLDGVLWNEVGEIIFNYEQTREFRNKYKDVYKASLESSCFSAFFGNAIMHTQYQISSNKQGGALPNVELIRSLAKFGIGKLLELSEKPDSRKILNNANSRAHVHELVSSLTLHVLNADMNSWLTLFSRDYFNFLRGDDAWQIDFRDEEMVTFSQQKVHYVYHPDLETAFDPNVIEFMGRHFLSLDGSTNIIVARRAAKLLLTTHLSIYQDYKGLLSTRSIPLNYLPASTRGKLELHNAMRVQKVSQCSNIVAPSVLCEILHLSSNEGGTNFLHSLAEFVANRDKNNDWGDIYRLTWEIMLEDSEKVNQARHNRLMGLIDKVYRIRSGSPSRVQINLFPFSYDGIGGFSFDLTKIFSVDSLTNLAEIDNELDIALAKAFPETFGARIRS